MVATTPTPMPSTPIELEAAGAAIALAAVAAAGTGSVASVAFTAIATSDVVELTRAACKSFGLCCTEDGTVTSWDIRLEVSLDGTNGWTAVLTHTRAGTGSDVTIFTEEKLYPSKYYRLRCEAITLGGGTGVNVVGIGLP